MKKLIIVFIVVAVTGIIVGLIFLSREDKKEIDRSISPTKKLLPTPTAYIDIPQNVRAGIETKLPYETPEFLVEYLPAVDKYYVTILAEPYNESYRHALLWLVQEGVPNPANNAKVRFVFAGYREY